MEDNFFDVCVQLCILGYLLGDVEKKHCFELVTNLLMDSNFQEWTSKLKMEEIEHTAWLLINHYGSDLLDDVKVALPKAMKTIITNIEYLHNKNKLELAQLKHNATKETFERTQGMFREILQSQKNEVYGLKWKQL